MDDKTFLEELVEFLFGGLDVDSATETIFHRLPDLLSTIVSAFSRVLSFLFYSLEDYVNILTDLVDAPSWVAGIIESFQRFTGNIFYDVPIIFIMLGIGVFGYMIYQFIVWLLNIIT